MKPEPDVNTPSAADDTQRKRVADILSRVELGDPSITDEVFWLQMQEDFISANSSSPPAPKRRG
jgi:hypothetical protein